MKILFATMQYGKQYGFGTERYLSSLAAELRNRGDEILFLSGDPEFRHAPISRFQLVEDDPFPVFAIPTQGILTITGQPQKYYEEFLRHHQPDIIHLANPAHIGLNVANAAFHLHIPVIVTIMDYWWLCPKHILLTGHQSVCDARVTWNDCVSCLFPLPQWRSAAIFRRIPGIRLLWNGFLSHAIGAKQGFSSREINRWLRRRTLTLQTLNRCKAIIFPSQTAQSLLSPSITHSETHRIPYGVDSLFLTTPHPSRNPSIPLPENLVIGFAGALAEHKGLHLLVEALHRLGWNQTTLRIAGSDSRSEYVQQIKERASGLRLEFLGSCSLEQMISFYDGIDLLVLPSLWPENTPFVLLEALARKVPVLGSDVPGIAEVLTDGRFQFMRHSSGDLAEKLRASLPLLSQFRFPSPETHSQMAERTRNLYLIAQHNS